jgi:signal transduction histidine kinase
MNLYSSKQRWKWFLVLLALLLVLFTLGYTQIIVNRIKEDEKQKVELWAQSISRNAQSTEYIDSLLHLLRAEEEAKGKLIGRALSIISNGDPNVDYSFPSEYLKENNSIPILLYDKDNRFQQGKNLPKGKATDAAYADSLRDRIKEKYAPILRPELGMRLYFDDSELYKSIEQKLNELNNSFLNNEVVGSTAVPIVVIDQKSGKVIKYARLRDEDVTNAERLEEIKSYNAPIKVVRPDGMAVDIYYEDSLVLQQIKYFPIGQLVLVAVFLMVSYLIFSTYRKAEQNQVWVGMAKETAHQLGTPLSSLMGWGALLETQGVEKSYIEELNKDVHRLQIITERFSKIGSQAELKEVDLRNTIQEAVDYVQKRVSKQIQFEKHLPTQPVVLKINEPLFGWVIENLVRNAADAMGESGRIEIRIFNDEQWVHVELSDTGKGIPKNKWKTVFKPGYTTKPRGWGLGLSLVKRIVEEYHKGFIYVFKSEEGQGTTFRIDLKR